MNSPSGRGTRRANRSDSLTRCVGTTVAKPPPPMRTLSVLVAVAVVLPAAAAKAQTVAVLPPSGVNVPAGTLEAVQDILRGHLAATGNFGNVTAVPGPVGRIEVAPATAVEQARGVGADLAAVVHIARLGSKAQVRLTAYAAATGATVYVDRMNAASPDDLDRVLARLAKGLASGRAGAETAELDTVTETEAIAPLKRAATHVFGLSLGAAIPSQGDPVPGMNVYWLYDARRFLADVTLGFHHADSGGDFTVGIGAYVPFGSADYAPFVGGGARWASTNYAGATGS